MFNTAGARGLRYGECARSRIPGLVSGVGDWDGAGDGRRALACVVVAVAINDRVQVGIHEDVKDHFNAYDDVLTGGSLG